MKTGQEKNVETTWIVTVLLFIVASEAIAQACIKKCKVTQKWHFFLLAVLFYGLVCIGLYTMYDYKAMGIVNLIWSCLSILSILMVGMVFFHEEINRYDIFGMLLIFVGLGFVFVKGH